MSETTPELTFDILAVVICTGLLLSRGRVSAFHPGLQYLFYHLYAVTLRLVTVLWGAIPIVSLHELLRAAFVSDIALIAVTALFLHLARTAGQQVTTPSQTTVRMLRRRYVVAVAAFSFLIGVPALWYFRFAGIDVILTRQFGSWSSSTWLWMTITWPLQAVLMWQYARAYRPLAVVFTAALFIITALSTGRYAVVIYGEFFCLAFLSRRGLRWPPIRIAVLLATIALVWFPLKIITAAARAGDELGTIADKAVGYTVNGVAEGSGDLQFLDEAAAVMALVDEHGHYYYGSTLLPLLVSPVPRVWWPDKPALNQYQRDISTQYRPIGTNGWVAMLIGEGYANFGYLGAVLYPVLAAWCYGCAYFSAMRKPHDSLGRFAYLAFLISFVQVFRDGIVSIFTFNLIVSMPMAFVVYLHWMFASRRRLTLMPAPRLRY